MRLQPDQLPLPRSQPVAVLTLGALRQVQLKLAALVTPIGTPLDVPLSRAAGRVLARDVPTDDGRPPPLLAAGTRLEARHLPLLAGLGHATAAVLARLRIGVMALLPDPPDDGHAMPSRERTGAAASAAWIVATADRLGAQTFEASARNPEPRRFIEKLEMFVGECELVVTVGFLSPALCEAVREAQVRRGQPAWIETLRQQPLGVLQVLRIGTTLVVALSADLESAVATFTTLLTPLIRRLQGRHDTLPDVRAAELDDPRWRDVARWRLFPAQVDAGALNTRVLLKSCDHPDAAQSLAAADGLAWHAAEFASFDRPTVAWFPFETWAG